MILILNHNSIAKMITKNLTLYAIMNNLENVIPI